MKDIIVIVGPTGVGKTKLSVELAKKIDAEIINGDSVAIYKKLNIGSAKPTIEERQNISHHLIDICDPKDLYSVYEYQKQVRQKIEEISKRGKRIIIVGGTGLYIKAALYDYRFEKEETTSSYDNLTNLEIMNKLKKYNENVAIHINNRKRLIRQLNKYENNSEVTNGKNTPLYPIKVIGLTTEREVLYDRINKRVDQMIDNGLLAEIEGLKDKYKTSRILNQAIGYKEFYNYLFEHESLDKTKEAIKLDSRRYAKRQYTFFRNQFTVKWFDVNFTNFNKTIEEVYNYIKN